MIMKLLFASGFSDSRMLNIVMLRLGFTATFPINHVDFTVKGNAGFYRIVSTNGTFTINVPGDWRRAIFASRNISPHMQVWILHVAQNGTRLPWGSPITVWCLRV